MKFRAVMPGGKKARGFRIIMLPNYNVLSGI